MTAEQMPIIADTTIRPAVLLFTMGLAPSDDLGIRPSARARGGRWQRLRVEGR